MRHITLPSGRKTSQLGFGCGPLHGGLLSGQSRRLLDVAYEAGIRHFDVAPSYGLGLAESVVGRHFASRNYEITIATKAGITRPTRPHLMSAVRAIVKPVLGRLPGWSAAAEQVRETTARSGCFEADFVRASLADSLTHLGLESVDLFLLHEIEPQSITHDLAVLLGELQQSRQVGAIGIGTTRANSEAIQIQYPQIAAVQQYRWNVFEPPLPSPATNLIITHGALGPALDLVAEKSDQDPKIRSRWSAAIDADLSDVRVLSDLLLAAAIAENKDGIILFNTKNPDRIQRAVEVAGDSKLIETGARLARTIREN